MGATVSKSFTKDVNVLIAKNIKSSSSKIAKAKEKGIKVLSYNDVYDVLCIYDKECYAYYEGDEHTAAGIVEVDELEKLREAAKETEEDEEPLEDRKKKFADRMKETTPHWVRNTIFKVFENKCKNSHAEKPIVTMDEIKKSFVGFEERSRKEILRGFGSEIYGRSVVMNYDYSVEDGMIEDMVKSMKQVYDIIGENVYISRQNMEWNPYFKYEPAYKDSHLHRFDCEHNSIQETEEWLKQHKKV